MPFDQIVQSMKRHYNYGTRKLQLQSEVDSLYLESFMDKHQIADTSSGLTELVDHINALAMQLPNGFGNDPDKNRYQRRAVMRLAVSKWQILDTNSYSS